MASNFFRGSLDGLFNYRNQTLLNTIEISDNHFTGTLPADLFFLPRLSTLVAGSNCLSIPLPSAVCSANSLLTLSLDGIKSAKPCRKLLAPGISSSYTIANHNSRTVLPLCIFNLTNIKTLHITGNFYGGAFPKYLSLGKHLEELALSYNLLTGSIPISIQNRKWVNLDLSYNRFTGVLSNNFMEQDVYETKIELLINRLSSSIPNALLPLRNIQILAGNLFTCNYADKS